MPTDAEIAWLAGIIEGEGCINIAPRIVRIAVGMTDRDIIERLEAMFPTRNGIMTKKPQGPHCKTQYIWRVGVSDQVREILTLILPWLGDRRAARAAEALEFLDARPGYRRDKKTHCKRGHPFDEANTYRNPAGYRSCRACSNQWALESRKRTGYRWLGDPRDCPVCGSEFRPTRKEQRTCGSSCGALMRWQTRRANALTPG